MLDSLKAKGPAQMGARSRAAFAAFAVSACAITGCGGQNSQVPSQPPLVATQRSPAQNELYALVLALDALIVDHERTPSTMPIAADLRRARADVVWLWRRAESWQSGTTVDAFVDAISIDRQVLAEAGRSPTARAAPLIDAVVRDLAVKARQCRTFGGPVPVDVHVVTRDPDNREVSGYEVWYVRKAYERVPAAFRRFEQNSSPAAHLFNEAGYYVFWADRIAAPTERLRGEPLDIEVGPDRLRLVVDLMVPRAPAAGGTAAP